MFKPGKYFIGDVSVVSEYAPKKQFKTGIPCANFLASDMIIPKSKHSGHFRVKNGNIGIILYEKLYTWENEESDDCAYSANDIGCVVNFKKPFSFMCTKGIFIIQSENILIRIDTNTPNVKDKYVIPEDEEYEYEEEDEEEEDEEEEDEEEEDEEDEDEEEEDEEEDEEDEEEEDEEEDEEDEKKAKKAKTE